MWKTRSSWLLVFSLIGPTLFAQSLDQAPPPLPPPGLPSDLPAEVIPAPKVQRPTRATPLPTIRPGYRVVRPAGAPAQRQPIAPRPLPPNTVDQVIAWDQMSKEYHAQAGELTAPFTFALTNKSSQDVTINWVRPSCGCTVAKLPPTPWKLAPGDHGTIELNVDLRGKYGILSKYVSVDTSHGQKMLNIRVHIPTGQPVAGTIDARTRNMQLAKADRQIVFRNDCASCHAAPAVGKTGGALFTAACAICHEAPHRATMVPDLKALTVVPTYEYWKHWITHGKAGSLMPAFAKDQGGILTDEQIDSLADYLTHHYPPKSTAAASTSNPGASATN